MYLIISPQLDHDINAAPSATAQVYLARMHGAKYKVMHIGCGLLQDYKNDPD